MHTAPELPPSVKLPCRPSEAGDVPSKEAPAHGLLSMANIPGQKTYDCGQELLHSMVSSDPQLAELLK
jgi:hypothetical protein